MFAEEVLACGLLSCTEITGGSSRRQLSRRQGLHKAQKIVPPCYCHQELNYWQNLLSVTKRYALLHNTMVTLEYWKRGSCGTPMGLQKGDTHNECRIGDIWRWQRSLVTYLLQNVFKGIIITFSHDTRFIFTVCNASTLVTLYTWSC